MNLVSSLRAPCFLWIASQTALAMTTLITNVAVYATQTQNTTNIPTPVKTQISTNKDTQNTTNTQTTIAIPTPVIDTCISFNNIAMQFSLVQPGMQPPVNLEQLKLILGNQKSESTSIITNYIWVYKNRILSVTALNNDLTNRLLTGNDDGSEASRKIQHIYEKLKTATSVWMVKEINSQLGQGRANTTKLHTYTWRCGNGHLQISADENSNIKSAQITYETNQDPIIIESQVGGTSHTPWDIVTDSNNQHQRGWKRTFT